MIQQVFIKIKNFKKIEIREVIKEMIHIKNLFSLETYTIMCI